MRSRLVGVDIGRGSMRIESSRFGSIEFDESLVIDFPQGIMGFPETRKYLLLGQGDTKAIGWLQAVDAPGVALPVASAHAFPTLYPDVPLTDACKAAGMDPPSENTAVLAVIVALPHEQATVNLLAPIVIDTDSRKGAQVILQGSRFSTRELLVLRSDAPVDTSSPSAVTS